ncbi:uncharacterized protein LOC127877333 [Dreissena polymorpha]|uniref:uncharacterized protein LOC127877333 n=1 Tax=Dreissena polymorpha TaxID=45954 RepID=UPI0022653DA4|nr:uncharacterized protein LOC127877333 [Dreissena polymorpha]
MAFADDTFETETFRSESLPDFSAEDDIQERETDYFLTLVNGVKKIDVGGRRRDPANARKADNFRDKIGNLKVLKNVAIVSENFKQRYAGLELSFDTIRKGIERISDVEKKIGYYMWTLHTREDELLAKIQKTKAALQEQHLKWVFHSTC